MASIGLSTILSAGGTALSVMGSIQQGRAAKAAANFQAAQMEQRAKAEMATSQRQAIEQRRQGRLMESRARAMGASGGVALSSPSLANILGGIDFEATQAADTTLAVGKETAQGYRTGAEAQRIEGRQAERAGLYGAAGSLATYGMSASGQSLFDKYGDTKTLPWQTKGNVKPAWMGGGRY